MNNLYYFLFFCFPMIFGMGCGSSVPTGEYRIADVSVEQICPGDFITFVVSATGNSFPTDNATMNLTKVGENSVNISLEGTNISIVAIKSESEAFVYNGILTETLPISECMVTESIFITLRLGEGVLLIDLTDNWASTAVGASCPFENGFCKNIFSFTGYPL